MYNYINVARDINTVFTRIYYNIQVGKNCGLIPIVHVITYTRFIDGDIAMYERRVGFCLDCIKALFHLSQNQLASSQRVSAAHKK